jgi:hypothetical protein
MLPYGNKGTGQERLCFFQFIIYEHSEQAPLLERLAARPWRTRSPLRGCYWSAWLGARHAALLTPKAHGRGS